MLIEQAGFKAFFIGGFPVAGVRYGLPDIGLLGLRELADAYRDILSVTKLPALVDADNGYGDHKNVVHAVHSLERLGAQALFFEDQVSPSAVATSLARHLSRAKKWKARSGLRQGSECDRIPS
jgi:2-methylisocitrate lyase-like PEP mutase family enzyme